MSDSVKLQNVRGVTNNTTLSVYLGRARLFDFTLNNRYNSAGARRPKNQAITVTIYEFTHSYGRSMSCSLSIPVAFQLLEYMDMSQNTAFIDMIKSTEWVEFLPAQYTGQLLMPGV